MEDINRVVDQSIFKKLTGAVSSTNATTDTSALTFEKLKASVQSFLDDRAANTREFWRELAQKHGPQTCAVAHIDAVVALEQTCLLDADMRPAWLHITSHVWSHDVLYFVKCLCLCHSFQNRRDLLDTGEWCCTCSLYEDII